jgi:GTPase SAR1 family protein
MAKPKTDIKVIVLGESNVGKTCLLQRYLTGEFAETVTSIGASLALKKWGDWNIALWVSHHVGLHGIDHMILGYSG